MINSTPKANISSGSKQNLLKNDYSKRRSYLNFKRLAKMIMMTVVMKEMKKKKTIIKY